MRQSFGRALFSRPRDTLLDELGKRDEHERIDVVAYFLRTVNASSTR